MSSARLELGPRSRRVVDASGFDYASFRLRRPVPCPPGTYCHPGSASEDLGMHNFTMPQPCLEVTVVSVRQAFAARHLSLEERGYAEPHAAELPMTFLNGLLGPEWDWRQNTRTQLRNTFPAAGRHSRTAEFHHQERHSPTLPSMFSCTVALV